MKSAIRNVVNVQDRLDYIKIHRWMQILLPLCSIMSNNVDIDISRESQRKAVNKTTILRSHVKLLSQNNITGSSYSSK